MTDEARNSLRTLAGESAKEDLIPIGARLLQVRDALGLSQPAFAARLGVAPKTYARWERGIREISVHGLQTVVELGWNANWLMTGEGAERLEALESNAFRVGEKNAEYPSHSLSDANLTIAIELADRCVGDGWLPRPLYAKLVRLLYEGVTQGLPVAQVLTFGRQVSQAMEEGGKFDDGEPQVGPAGGRRAG